MLTGNQQICVYAIEPTYGSITIPNSHFGIVIEGELHEDNDINYIYPLGVNVASELTYMDSSYNGWITSSFNPVVFSAWALQLASFTIDCGVRTPYLLPRRYIGAMCDSCSITISNNEFIKSNYNFIAQRCDNGINQSIPYPPPLYINTGIQILVNGVLVSNFETCTLQVSNNLTGVYTTDRNKPDMRSFVRLKSTNRSIVVTIEGNDYVYNVMRGVRPENYIEIVIGLFDICNNVSTTITLIDCKQQKVSEVLSPIKSVNFSTTYDCRNIIIN